jgi:hypothetical protein
MFTPNFANFSNLKYNTSSKRSLVPYLHHLFSIFSKDIIFNLFFMYLTNISVREHCSELVLFFHSNTQYIEGLGDVCTFAQMNIERDGDPRLTTLIPISSCIYYCITIF